MERSEVLVCTVIRRPMPSITGILESPTYTEPFFIEFIPVRIDFLGVRLHAAPRSPNWESTENGNLG